PDVLTTDDARALTNAPRFSILYTVACIPGNFENVLGCFGRGFIEAENGGGFFIGNSRYGWYWPGNPGYGTGDLFDREFFKSLFVRDFDHLGVVHADAKVQRIPWSQDNGTDRWTQFTSNLFGDPETPVWKDTPLVLAASHPDSIDVGDQVVSVSVNSQGSPLADARVCLWMDFVVYEVDYTGSDGSVDFTVSPSDTGTMFVTVTKNGYLPYLGTIRVTNNLSGLASSEIVPGISVRIAPNPVVGQARINYSYGSQGEGLSVSIYDASGRLIRMFEVKDASPKGGLTWDGRLEDGRSAPAGIYFVKIRSENQSSTTTFVFLR
ncbi:MAG TPA: T9SS type A sorting domain-containing protein, partial [Firmicutes bacterium]|nr:T9SS type A sorting domain-containing protein [Bacillota bacterium]